MNRILIAVLATAAVLGSSGCTSVAQGKSTFTVHCGTFLGIGCGFEDAEAAIPAGGKVTNVNHDEMFFGLFKASTIGGTK